METGSKSALRSLLGITGRRYVPTIFISESPNVNLRTEDDLTLSSLNAPLPLSPYNDHSHFGITLCQFAPAFQTCPVQEHRPQSASGLISHIAGA